MNIYFDSTDHCNLKSIDKYSCHNYSVIMDNHHTLDDFKLAGFTVKYTNDMDENGLYVVNVSGHSPCWCFYDNRRRKHVLHFIPKKVLKRARNREIIIVINGFTEGAPVLYNNTDGYKKIHQAMDELKLPKYSVILITGNANGSDEYKTWCKEHRVPHKIKHLSMFFFSREYCNIPVPDVASEKALENVLSVSYNSLNRTVRPHRLDHLYFLLKNNYHLSGFVSGTCYDYASLYTNNVSPQIPESKYLNIPYDEYTPFLESHCPLIIDSNWVGADRADPCISGDENFRLPQHVFNRSLLSIVTESEFDDNCLFLTEKTFKPIAMGSIFMILGGAGSLKVLEKLGYNPYFKGIDPTYDTIKDPTERFNAFHAEFTRWFELGRDKQRQIVRDNLDIVAKNQKHYQTTNHNVEAFVRLRQVSTSIFEQHYESNKPSPHKL